MNKRIYIITASILAAAITVGLTGPANAATGQVTDSTASEGHLASYVNG